MTIPRIIIKETAVDGQLVTLKDAPYRYLARVNRLRTGGKFQCSDTAGKEFVGEIVDVKIGYLTAYLYLVRETAKPRVSLHACFGLLKGEKNEFVIKAGSQLGVTSFSPVIMERTILRLDAVRRAEKEKRFRKVAEETARTSFLSYVPEINEIKDLSELSVKPDVIKLLFTERKGIPLLKEMEAEIISSRGIITLFGPEGGIGEEEHEMLERKGFIPVSLGDRALKAEFAFTFGMSIIAYLTKGAI